MAIATLTCPKCRKTQQTAVPSDRCLAFYRCHHCKRMVAARKRCCVICEFSDSKCPRPHA
ncbi:MAG TPA: GDCCVxC domain-containing (seleno)protein [archaeon]|nr:GDCCVxC domain-containing (seleno)protein [archaeon]